MATRSDVIVNSISALLMLITVGAHVWALYYRYRLTMKHLANPVLVKEDVVEMISVSMTGIGMAVLLGVFITLLLKR